MLLISKGVIRENLSNGLCLLLKRVDTTPVVAVVTYGKSGTLHDPDDLNGLSELLQRLYFQGSEKYPSPLAVNQAVFAVGGILSSSAFLDHTISYSVSPGNHVNQALSVQADALQRPLLDEATIRAEREALFGEGALRARSPAFRATELSHGLAYRKGRLGRLRMAPAEGLAKLSRAELVALHRNQFRPENVIVSVVGNIDVQPVLRALSDSYSEVELGPPARLPSPTEDQQNSPRFIEEICSGTKAQLRIGFAAPGEMGSDRYALEALCCLIDQGFLVRHFRDFPGQARLLEAVTASYALIGSSGLWTFHASLEQGGLLQTEQAIFEALDLLRRELIPADELARAKNLLRTRFLANQQFMHRQAEALAHFEALGGYHLVDVYLGKLSSITVQDVQAVCERYLSFDKACVVQCRAESDVSAPSDLKSLYLAMEPAAGPGGPRPNVRWRKTPGEVRVTRLSGGPNLVLQSTKKIPVIAVGAFYAGGRWDEKPDQAGWTQLCLNLTSGSAQARRILALGCSLYPMVTRDYFGLALSCLPDDFKVAGKLFMNLLRRPVYAEETVRIEGQALAMAARGRQSSELRCLDLLLEALYGEHPYGWPALGSPSQLQTARYETLVPWHRQILRRDRMVVSALGDVDEERLVDLVMEIWDGERSDTEPEPPATPTVRAGRHLEASISKPGCYQMLAYPACSAAAPERAGLMILQAALRDDLWGLRQRLGPLPGVDRLWSIGPLWGQLAGALCLYAVSDRRQESELRDRIAEAIERIATELMPEDVLERARETVLGKHQLRQQSPSAVMLMAARNQLLGLGAEERMRLPDVLRAVSRDQLHYWTRQWLDSRALCTGVVRG